MERAVKHARIMAVIKAPPDIVRRCVEGQGASSRFEKSYAINEQIRNWLIENVLDGGDPSLITPVEEQIDVEDMGSTLPVRSGLRASDEITLLPSVPAIINDDQIEGIVKRWQFFDAELNPGGRFENVLGAGPDPQTVIDHRTSLMWQRGGLDIGSLRMIEKKISAVNDHGFVGFHDWRLPTLEEAMSLLEPEVNGKGVHLHPCFSREQPFIFVAARRKPGGLWFVDYKQGRCFWSSGTIPGGFGRLVRDFA
jgi:hypothetical protein